MRFQKRIHNKLLKCFGDDYFLVVERVLANQPASKTSQK